MYRKEAHYGTQSLHRDRHRPERRCRLPQLAQAQRPAALCGAGVCRSCPGFRHGRCVFPGAGRGVSRGQAGTAVYPCAPADGKTYPDHPGRRKPPRIHQAYHHRDGRKRRTGGHGGLSLDRGESCRGPHPASAGLDGGGLLERERGGRTAPAAAQVPGRPDQCGGVDCPVFAVRPERAHQQCILSRHRLRCFAAGCDEAGVCEICGGQLSPRDPAG